MKGAKISPHNFLLITKRTFYLHNGELWWVNTLITWSNSIANIRTTWCFVSPAHTSLNSRLGYSTAYITFPLGYLVKILNLTCSNLNVRPPRKPNFFLPVVFSIFVNNNSTFSYSSSKLWCNWLLCFYMIHLQSLSTSLWL